MNEDFDFSDLSVLSPGKLENLDNVLKIILKSSAAQDAFAQIIAGSPTWQSPPSQAAKQKYDEFRESFSARVLKLDTRVR